MKSTTRPFGSAGASISGDMLWTRCARFGRVLLPLVDQEPWRQDRRHENLRTWGIDTVEGEQLIEVFAALAAHAVAAEASMSAAEFDALPLSAVADAATGKRDIDLLAGPPETFAEAVTDRPSASSACTPTRVSSPAAGSSS
ncbi:hypothetical protein ACFZCY_44030 [Streptomyces sp. NPDC007983]|uniref:hypothetical protein n=1 Tax=Streptomyces sp. NPDC007983 TaxID=3364800 RepID=UPI0036ED1A60